MDLSCLILITDTKSVWAEGTCAAQSYDVIDVFSRLVMTSNQFARRWRDCNKLDSPPSYVHNDDEDEWRTHILELLTKVHTIGGVTDTSFEVVESNYAVSGTASEHIHCLTCSFALRRTSHSSWTARHSNGDGKHASWATNFRQRSYRSIL